MSTATIRADDRAIHLTWDDGEQAELPFLWLRDNCPSAFDPETSERTFDLLSVAVDIAPEDAHLDGGELVVAWADGAAASRFPLASLRSRRPGRARPDPAAVTPHIWPEGVTAADVPRAEATALADDDAALLTWLKAVKRFGVGLVEGLADDTGAGLAIAQRIAFLRETNFGVGFDVVSKPDPNNLAYTAKALPLHTDLPNQELPPGFQFLHCIANGAAGGGSVLCDGYAVAEALRAQDPAAFDLLATVAIPFRFHDQGWDIRRHATVIECQGGGPVREVRFNAHIACVFDMPAGVLRRYYPAYRRFMALTREPARSLTLKLSTGEMVVFDNRRVLHGREAFDPATGLRRLRGCYVDRGDLDSRIRQLSGKIEVNA